MTKKVMKLIAVLLLSIPVVAFARPNNCSAGDFSGTWVSQGLRRCEIVLNANGQLVSGSCSGQVNGKPIVLPIGNDMMVQPQASASLSTGERLTRTVTPATSNWFRFYTTQTRHDCEFGARITQVASQSFVSGCDPSATFCSARTPIQTFSTLAEVNYEGVMNTDGTSMVLVFRGIAQDLGYSVVGNSAPPGAVNGNPGGNSSSGVVGGNPGPGRTVGNPSTYKTAVGSYFGSTSALDTIPIVFTKVF